MHQIGALIAWSAGVNLEEKFNMLKELDLTCCQLCCWEPSLYTDSYADYVNECVEKTGVTITALWAGWTPSGEWNITYGPSTLGIVPVAHRAHRMEELKAAARFAKKINVVDVATHVGFIPETPDQENFWGLIGALRELGRYFKSLGRNFLFETGQETPFTMLRTIETVGLPNLFINFDTANLMLYGRGNTLDALKVFGKYVKNVHFKDGHYPTDGMNLGREVPLGEGDANIAAVVKKLDELGYEGPWIIEREITGDQQKADIAKARDLLREIEATL